MWEELISNEVWYTDEFIDEDLVDKTLDRIKKSETKTLDGNEQPHIVDR